jgi:hypothetical protein
VTTGPAGAALSSIDLLSNYAYIFLAAFVVVLLARRSCAAWRAFGVVDRPDFKRAQCSRSPTGGLAVFAGLLYHWRELPDDG